MPNLNQTIDRSLQISRNVATVYERRICEAVDAYTALVRRAQARYVADAAPAPDTATHPPRTDLSRAGGVDRDALAA